MRCQSISIVRCSLHIIAVHFFHIPKISIFFITVYTLAVSPCFTQKKNKHLRHLRFFAPNTLHPRGALFLVLCDLRFQLLDLCAEFVVILEQGEVGVLRLVTIPIGRQALLNSAFCGSIVGIFHLKPPHCPRHR